MENIVIINGVVFKTKISYLVYSNESDLKNYRMPYLNTCNPDEFEKFKNLSKNGIALPKTLINL
jgi:hypothetical protein